MQTFITSYDMGISAQNLDWRRLGRQRVEAIQIANNLLIKEDRWINHPAVKMWRSWEPYLVYVYLKEHMMEWDKRGYENRKTVEQFSKLDLGIQNKYGANCRIERPNWITIEFILAHRSNLIRKNPGHYRELFGSFLPDNLPYIWPV